MFLSLPVACRIRLSYSPAGGQASAVLTFDVVVGDYYLARFKRAVDIAWETD